MEIDYNKIADDLDLLLPDWAKRENWILSGLRGSHAHGTYIPPEDKHGTDDLDVFVVTIQPTDFYLGLRHNTCQHFETGGDYLDVCVYDVRKFVTLLEKGNPNVHQWIWTDHTKTFFSNRAGIFLKEQGRSLIGKEFFHCLKGYAAAQLHKMSRPNKHGYMGQKREKLIAEYGIDLKQAAHCIRLLHSGILYLDENILYVEPPIDARSEIIDIKTGKIDRDTIVGRAQELFSILNDKLQRHSLPIILPEHYNELLLRTLKIHTGTDE